MISFGETSARWATRRTSRNFFFPSAVRARSESLAPGLSSSAIPCLSIYSCIATPVYWDPLTSIQQNKLQRVAFYLIGASAVTHLVSRFACHALLSAATFVLLLSRP